MTDELEHITDLASVRRRAAMYFHLDSPLVANCMAREAYCLAIDQIAAGDCTELVSELTSDGFLAVTHNGKALAVESGTGFGGYPEMLFVAERLGFCADRAASEYVNTHVCKNGITALNACCERFALHNFYVGNHYRLAYDCGTRVGEIENLGKCTQRGVMIRFKLDASIVLDIRINLGELERWFASVPIDISKTNIVWRDRS